MTKTLYPQNSS